MTGQGFTNSQIGRKLIISRKTISSFLSRDRIRSVKKLPVGRPTVITGDIKIFIIEVVEFNPFITLIQIKIKERLLLDKLVKVGKSSISKVLLGKKITVKKTQIISIERNFTRTIKLRFEYVKIFYRMARTITNLNIIYIDESGFNLYITNNYGRAKPGVSPTTEVPASRGAKYNLNARDQ